MPKTVWCGSWLSSQERMSYVTSSSSSSSTTQSHDVFMSFRGDDTRMGFVSHLYDALTRKHIRTYKDDRTHEIGITIHAKILQAIETSRFAIVVLSSNFATSKWCLEEIVKVVDCMERGKLIVIPVFYHVSPSDVRHLSNFFKQAFDNHEVDPEITHQKVEIWRASFVKVGAISGLHVTQHRNESEVIGEIVKKISKNMQDTIPKDLMNGLVGIESRVEEVKVLLSMESSEVRYIGICGMSGIGKTTLAEVVYEGIQNKYQECSFIENIKDISKENDSTGLCKLQQKLLDDILKEESIRVQSVKHGQTLLGTKLRGLKVIIVLDDVNHVDQLTYLAGGPEWFGPGTRVIVTTTNVDLLNPHRINEIYRCEELKGDEALSLFCQSAFKERYPTTGYEKLSDHVVKLAGGHPLALNVYGSLLCGKEEKYWNEMLKKLQEYPQKEVLGRLEVVYARLDRDQRDAFIYIACFLKGRNKDLVTDILRDIGLFSHCGVPDLINKFLVTINYDDNVWIHDLLQQMCWEIIRKESRRYDGETMAIKYRRDVVDILSSKLKGTRTIEIINQEPYKVECDDCIVGPKCFSKMTKLKFLRISNVQLPKGLKYLSSDIRILEWYGCPLKSLPLTFEPKHIYELEMCCSQLETLWENELDLPNLRVINLSFSKNLSKIPDLTATPNLRKLNLEGCTSLRELDKSVLLHRTIQYMNLKGCTHLQNLGRSTMEMEVLEALLLCGCSNLEYIPEFGQSMNRLEHLYVDGTSIRKLPDNLGEMCHLRKLDASETSIEELPPSIHRLKRLRLMSLHGCPISSQTRGFLHRTLDTLLSGLRELDLSSCHLSVVPDGIGLLYRLISLDLSGNDFVSLPASIGLLSNLKMLCLNNCKRLQSLPKLSIVNEDTLYGLQIRFNYYISGEWVEISKYHASSNNTSPTIFCLNCPKLAENERGSYLAEKALNGYLQLRTKYWITPEAVFEIVGAGREIPSVFTFLTSAEHLILEGPWVGVAICAVISVHHSNTSVEAKYMVTVHIHVGEKHWKIPVCINFLVPGLENQLVIYWTLADDLQRLVDSRQSSEFRVSFSMETADGNLQVTNFGVRIIRDEDILKLKQPDHSTNMAVKNLFQPTSLLPVDLRWYISACKADTDLHSCHTIIDDMCSSIIRFILNYRNQQDSLNGMHKIIKSLIGINQEVASVFKEEWRDTQLFTLVYDYYRISRGTYEILNDFIRFLKEISSGWLGVKLALEQIVVKSREDDYTYEEMLHQLNDIEGCESVKFTDNFATSFACICKQTVAFSRHFNEEIQDEKKFKSVKVLAKLSSIIIAGIFSIMATYMGDSELLQDMKNITSYCMWLHTIERFSMKSDKWFNTKGRHMIPNHDRELWISDFYANAILLQQLKKNAAQFSSLTTENKAGMMIVIHKLEKNIDNFSVIIDDMRSHAHIYSHDIRLAGITFNPLIENGHHLQVTGLGVYFSTDKDVEKLKQREGSVSEVMSSLYRATLSLPADLPWYACASEVDTDHTTGIVKFILNYGKQRHPLDTIRYIFECLHEINQEALIILSESVEEWTHGDLYGLNYNYYELMHGTYALYHDVMSFLKDISDSWSSVKVSLEQIVFKYRVGAYTYESMVLELGVLVATKIINPFHARFVETFDSICERMIDFLRHFSVTLEANKSIKQVKVVATVSRVIIAGNYSMVATYMGEFELLRELKEITSDSMLIDLIQRFPRKGGEWFGYSREAYAVGSQVWNSYGNTFLREVRMKMALYDYFSKEIEDEMLLAMNKLQKNIHNFSNKITDMFVVACNFKEQEGKLYKFSGW